MWTFSNRTENHTDFRAGLPRASPYNKTTTILYKRLIMNDSHSEDGRRYRLPGTRPFVVELTRGADVDVDVRMVGADLSGRLGRRDEAQPDVLDAFSSAKWRADTAAIQHGSTMMKFTAAHQ